MAADALECPRDRVAMRLQAYWKYPRHQCGQCRGLFLGEEHIVHTLGRSAMEGFGERATGTVSTAIGKVAETLPESTLRCPSDGTTMRVFVYKKVELDICPSCRSLWLDEGEFAKVRVSSIETYNLGRSGSRFQPDVGIPVDPIAGIMEFVGEALGALLDGLGGL